MGRHMTIDFLVNLMAFVIAIYLWVM